METILLLAYTETDGSLSPSGLEALGVAKSLVARLPESLLVVGLIGHQHQPAANQVANCGASRFLAIIGTDYRQARYGSDAAAAEAVCRKAEATVVVVPATSRGNRVVPGLAQRLSGRVDTHVTQLSVEEGQITLNRWFYRQRMEAQVRRTQRPWFISVEPGSHSPWSGPLGQAAVEVLPLELPETSKRTTVMGVREPPASAQTIRPDAELLLVAGAGWTKKQADGHPHVKEAEALILNCLRLARASLGSTKSLVDLGGEGQAVLSFLTHLNQVGQTGSTPRHPKGLATCCHGEEPHTVGWRFVNERRAVNLDPNCGWARGKADVLYVADAFAVVERLNQLLTAAGAGEAVAPS